MFALHLERIERRVTADRQALMIAVALSSRKTEITFPTVEAAFAEFEALLFAEPAPVDTTDRRVLLNALGVT